MVQTNIKDINLGPIRSYDHCIKISKSREGEKYKCWVTISRDKSRI